MRVAIGADHAGFPLKETVIKAVEAAGHSVLDLGIYAEHPEPSDYPDAALAVGRALQRAEADRGILLCGSGVGASIAANKLRGIRAGVCHDVYSAHQSVEHDDMNVLCLGPRVIGPGLAIDLVNAFLRARFSGEERHRRRVAKIAAMEGEATMPRADAVTANRITALREQFGQSVWIDFISRDALVSGELARLVEDGVVGLTSNPTIFEKAISSGKTYDADIAALASQGRPVKEAYEALAMADIASAADLLRTVYDRTDGLDGYVSLEVSPYLAHDTAGTIAEAKRLFAAVRRPNLMIKVPGTPSGVPAIAELIGSGININVTLLFALDAYEAAALAYLDGLEAWTAKGGAVHRVASVASFFVSRVDSVVDKMLAGHPREAELRGRAAVANAKLAYARFGEIVSGQRWQALAAKGARVQRPLWASTGTKNPNYRDTIYVDDLIGPHTVNTMPPQTLSAFRDHGQLAETVTGGVEEARHFLAALAAAGIDMDRVTQELLQAGVASFSASFDQLLDGLKEKMAPG
jgi:transaldolase